MTVFKDTVLRDRLIISEDKLCSDIRIVKNTPYWQVYQDVSNISCNT
jgi:hypothetical protein